MRQAAASTRERILEQGLALMTQAGLSGVTLGVLAARVGMSKSGLFAHFRSKEEVQIGLLDYMAEFATAQVVAPAMKIDEGLPRLKMLVAKWFGWTRRAGLPGGCPVAAGLFEFDDIRGPVRNKILAMENEWRELADSVGAASRGSRSTERRSGRRPICVGTVRHLPGPSCRLPLSAFGGCGSACRGGLPGFT